MSDFVDTGIRRQHMTGALRAIVGSLELLARPFTHSPAKVGRAIAHLAATGDAERGVLLKADGRPVRWQGDRRYALDLRRGLWEISQRLIAPAGPPSFGSVAPTR